MTDQERRIAELEKSLRKMLKCFEPPKWMTEGKSVHLSWVEARGICDEARTLLKREVAPDV